MLLSRFPLEDQQLVDFFDISTTSRRVALLASIQGEQASYRVACTHLTSNLDGVLPYTGPFGSWGSETSAQAERLLAEVGGIERVLLAGDFNCSQANGDTGAEQDLASVCQTIRASGFSDLAAEQLRCSYCNENILNQLKQNLGEQQDLVLDHVFSRGITAVSGAELLYDEIIQIAGGNSQLSDHYAVSIVYATP